MNLRSTIVRFVIALILTAVMPAQTHRTATTASGTVEGRVFGITRGGDLKPARMPNIYLLYKGRGEKLEEDSADDRYQNASLAALRKRLDQQLEHPSTDDGDLRCREGLLDTDQTLVDTAQWALDNRKVEQVLTADGDEEGHFRIAKVPIGHYRLVAREQAGANDGYW